MLNDYDNPLEAEITELGLEYNLLTSYTSFVAIDKIVRADGSEVVTAEQPLPVLGFEEEDDDDWGGLATAVVEEQVMASWLGRSFVWRDSQWVDLAFTPDMPLVAYDPTAAQPVALATFARLDKDMIVVLDHTAYDLGSQPVQAALEQNYPNPFNSGTMIRYSLDTHADVVLAVYNLAGQEVATLVEGDWSAGSYSVRWDGRYTAQQDLASGVYLYRLQVGNQVEIRKLMLVR